MIVDHGYERTDERTWIGVASWFMTCYAHDMQVIIDSVANKQTLGRIGAGGLLDVSCCCDVLGTVW